MKKTLLIILFCILTFAGCQKPVGTFRLPSSLEDLVSISPNIFIAQVEKVLPAERVKQSEVAEISEEKDSYLNFTPVQVKVIKAIKGSVTDDMTLNISLSGGNAEGVNEVHESFYSLEEGKTYLLFVTGQDTTKKHCYRLVVPYYPNPQIVDGKLEDYAEEAFHLPSGLTVDEVVEEILKFTE